jgi:hypothetical protein
MAEQCPRCGKFTKGSDMRPVKSAAPSLDGVPGEPVYVCVRCAPTPREAATS